MPSGLRWLPLVFALFVLGSDQGQTTQTTPAQPQGQTTFRSVVDVVAVDVSVVDKSGRPVDNLKPEEFTLKVDGKTRRIRSAEFVSLRKTDDEADASNKNFSATSATAPGRLIMLVVDQANIRKGDGKSVFRAAEKFVAGLNRNDRVALQIIPGTGPIVDFTSNHAFVSTMLDRAVGQAVEADTTGKIGVAEALGVVEDTDPNAWQGITERECAGDLNTFAIADCRKQLEVLVRVVYQQTRVNTSASLLSLRQIIDRLSLTSEPKTIVLISEGIVIDRNVGDISWVGPRTADARVSLYGIRLSAQGYDVALARTSPTRERDQQLLAEGMDMLIGAGRGTVIPVAVNADAVFNRLSLELSGYYLLSFEPGTGDRDGKPHQIAVNTNRAGATVRARREFSAEPSGATKPMDEQLADALRSALPASDFPIKVTTFPYKDDESGRIKLVVMAELDRRSNPAGPMGLAFYVADEKGGLAGTDMEKALTPAPGQEGQPQLYMTAVVVDPGAYRLKLAASDGEGHRASVERTLDARLTSVGQLRMSGLMLAEPGTKGGSSMRPSVDGIIDTASVIGHVELYSDAEPQLDTASINLEIAANEDGRAIQTAPMTIASSKPGKRIAQATIPVSLLTPGNYVARAVLMASGRPIARVVREFSVPVDGRPSAAARSAAPAAAGPVAFSSTIDRFDSKSVLTRPVVGFFLDRISITGQPPVPASLNTAIGFARSGQYVQLERALADAHADHIASEFLAGIARLAQGDPNDGAHHFAAALRVAPSFFPATFYLGACYAATGQDREAILAWRSSLVTDPAAPWIFTLLSDALMRVNQIPQALAVLADATKEFPTSDDVLVRRAIAFSRAGDPKQTLTLLDPYFTRHPDDTTQLLLAMRLIYEGKSASKPVESVDADRARFHRYFDAYQRANGPELAQARQWLALIDA